MLYLSFFFMVTLLAYTTLLVSQNRSSLKKRRQAGKGDAPVARPRVKPRLGASAEVFEAIWHSLKRHSQIRMQGEKADRVELKLMRAGKPLRMSPVDLWLLQIILLLIIPLLFGIYAVMLGIPFGGCLIFIMAGMVAAVLVPSLYLKLKTKQRCRAALKELPDVLDMLTVSLEAGLGFDAALHKLVSRKTGVLSEEFSFCLEEIRLGKTRREALLGVRDRLQLEELKLVISRILQAEKLGIGMAQVLRVQSQEVREQRRQRAEEEAMKAPIKILFPLVLFIFPSLFIVLLGPAVIQFFRTFYE
ncbi:type II secretion system F family protein [Paenibacillus abyssi]|uniref:Type II secretion system protein GspF domain-containing protein n=1 Tax=Paenibacillus abyssi TaxID=1340531 RepID=A0A917FRZ0_9BACL|nr:type II secretion system F family protein [Paenibacillus abyssi]GGG00514.1 hypothetical protein GCM10010916_17100 [Paenibacillus abyssi]